MTWLVSQMAPSSITPTTSITSQGWSLLMSCTTRWRELVRGRQFSAFEPQHASIKSAHMETTWSRRRLMIWFCVLWSTRTEYWYMNLNVKQKTIIGLRGAGWWQIRDICSFRQLCCTRRRMVKDVLGCTMRPSHWQIFPTCPLITLTRALWRSSGPVVPSQGLASTKEISNQSKPKRSSICRNYVGRTPVHWLKQDSSKRLESCQKWHNISHFTPMDCSKRRLFLLLHKRRLVVNTLIQWPTWNSRSTQWALRKSSPTSTHKSMISAIQIYPIRNFLR